jgi:hypothetical protein
MIRRYIQRRWGTRLMRLLWGHGKPAQECETRLVFSQGGEPVAVEHKGTWR